MRIALCCWATAGGYTANWPPPWMWVAALGGIALWAMTRPKRRLNNALAEPSSAARDAGLGLTGGYAALLRHRPDLVAMGRRQYMDKMRAAFGWLTPQVNTQLHGEMQMTHDPHAGHHMDAMAMAQHQPALQLAQFDQALAAARQAGLNASRLEIRPPVSDDRAWTVNEIDRRWPTQVDAVAIDGATMQVVDRTRFADFPLMAKLTRWGVDFHMGILFGLANQLLLVGFGCALCVTIGVGYRLWWIRRPPQAAWDPARSLLQAWLSLAWPARSLVLGLAFAPWIGHAVNGSQPAAVHCR